MLDQAREFIVLAKHLNFVRAAEELHISQPTLTRHIACLERELGFKLLNRNPMALTKAGENFRESISGIIDQLDAAIDRGRCISAETGKGILVNIVLSSNNKFSDFVYEAMAAFHERYPYTPAPRLFHDNSISIVDSVTAGKTDIGLVFTKPVHLPEGFTCEHLLDLPLAVYLHNENPLTKRNRIAVEDLRNCHLVCPANPYLQTTFEGAVETMREHGIEPKYRVREIDEFDRIPSTLRQDEFLFKTDQCAPLAPPASFLSLVHFEEPAPQYHIYALYRNDPKNHALANFVRLCHSLIDPHAKQSA